MTGTSNADEAQPYAPEGIDRIGRPPENGEGGERGSSAFEGNSEFSEDGSLDDDVTEPSEGPKRGVDYYADVYSQAKPAGQGAQKNSRESATKQ